MSAAVAKDAGPAATRHVTFLTARAVDHGGERFIEGWASTGREDRMGDIVSPEGAKYALPIPLLFQHQHDRPIGSVVSATVSRAGIRIRAKLTAGVAQADEVWKLIVDGALNAVSVGFRALKTSPLPSGGLRFDSWEWYELSVVSVPANPDAKIAIAKCLAYAERSAAPAPASEPAIPAAWRSAVSEFLRPGESELQRHYRQYDACIELLPSDLRAVVDLRRSGAQKGVMHLIAVDGQPLATVDLRTRSLRLASEPEPASPAPVAQATAMDSIARRIARLERHALPFAGDTLAEVLGGLVGKSMQPLLTRIAVLESQMKALRERIEKADA